MPASATAYDPFSAAAAEKLIGNVEAGVPPQCYTRTGANSNPCWTCHTSRNGRNQTDDWRLQQRYDFSDLGRTNHWTNLFQDRRAAIAGIGDAEALSYIRQDNYAALRPALLAQAGYQGWVPDLDYRQGFDAEGFARDGSDWRAFRYKPFPGTFWPTNGSADDVLIRLPARFRTDATGHPSRAVYKANLAILEAAMTVPDTVPDASLSRGIEPIDEAAAGLEQQRIDIVERHIVGIDIEIGVRERGSVAPGHPAVAGSPSGAGQAPLAQPHRFQQSLVFGALAIVEIDLGNRLVGVEMSPQMIAGGRNRDGQADLLRRRPSRRQEQQSKGGSGYSPHSAWARWCSCSAMLERVSACPRV